MLNGEYGRNIKFKGEVKYIDGNSYLWRAFVSVWPKILDISMWVIGNGETMRFWTDRWVDGYPQLTREARSEC